MSQNEFEGDVVLKYYFGISVAICNYIIACALLCAPEDHSSLMLPSLHDLRACSARSAAEWGFGRVLGQNHRHHHIFGNMQIHHCMCMAVCSCGS